MANTYTQLNVHSVFTVKGRENFLLSNYKTDLFRYISGILNNIGQYSLAVNGCRDHIHIFFELNPKDSISDIIKEVKANSSRWINENKFVKCKFSWQEGFGAFSYNRSQRNNVINYIKNQEEHHKIETFKVEYLDLLEKFEVDFDPRYLFEFYD